MRRMSLRVGAGNGCGANVQASSSPISVPRPSLQKTQSEILRRPRAGSALARRRLCPHSHADKAPESPMTQTSNRFFDEVARLMNDAAGVASGVRREFDTVMKTQAERILRDLDVVQREEFEAVKEMARLAAGGDGALQARIAALEAKLGGAGAAKPDNTFGGNG